MYGKIYESTFTGSLVGSGAVVFAVWSYVIAHTKPPGVVEMNPALLASVLGCQKDDVEGAIGLLCSPDSQSRTPDHDGKRLLREGPFLYRVPTWERYNAMRNNDERRTYNRDAQRRSRASRTAVNPSVIDGQQPSSHVSTVSRGQPIHTACSILHAEEESTPRAKRLATNPEFDRFWLAYDKKVGRAASERAWKRARIDDRLFPVVLEATKEYVAATPDKAFRRHPATWLNQRGWEDEIVQPGTSGRSSTSKCVVPKDLSKEDWGESGPI